MPAYSPSVEFEDAPAVERQTRPGAWDRPGSELAVHNGCTCPGPGSAYGDRYMVFSLDCDMHDFKVVPKRRRRAARRCEVCHHLTTGVRCPGCEGED